MTLKLILAFVIAFAVSAVVGFFLVPYLRRIKAGQSIKENGPTWHMSKQGTPTMGRGRIRPPVLSGVRARVRRDRFSGRL